LLALGVLACATAQPVDLILYDSAPTLQWDAVTEDVDGSPLIPEDEVTYDVYAYDWVAGVTSDQDPAQLTYMGLAPAPELVLTFPYRAVWVVGVRTRVTQGDGTAYYSERIAWSNVATDTEAGVPFGYAPTLGGVAVPKTPEGLRDSGM
jgi:hypothetical protein